MVAASRSLPFARLLRLVQFTVLGAVTAGPLRAQAGFPHAAHEGLFPMCVGCHPAAAYDEGGLYPSAALCANCHDGKAYRSVQWTARAVQRTSFQHIAHQVQVDALPRTRTFCLLCHGDMASHAAPRSCIECHPLGRVRG